MAIYTYATFDDPSASTPFTLAHGLNGMGQIVGTYINTGTQHGFLLSAGTYTTIDDPLGAHSTEALGINGSGQIVGLYAIGSAQHGFLYNPTGGIYTTIDFPGANGTFAQGINAAGQIVGQYRDAG